MRQDYYKIIQSYHNGNTSMSLSLFDFTIISQIRILNFMIMHEHLGFSYFEVSFCLCYFAFLYSGSEPSLKVNQKHPSFQSIWHPSCHFTTLGSKTCVPFSHFLRASRELESISLSYLYKIPKVEHGTEEWIHIKLRLCCAQRSETMYSDNR